MTSSLTNTDIPVLSIQSETLPEAWEKAVIEVWDKVLKDINPIWIINEEVFDSELAVFGDQTILSRDYLVAEDKNGVLIGFAGLFKSSKRNFCNSCTSSSFSSFSRRFFNTKYRKLTDLSASNNGSHVISNPPRFF